MCFSRQSKRRTLGKDPPPRVRNVTLSPWLENTDFSDALGLAQERGTSQTTLRDEGRAFQKGSMRELGPGARRPGPGWPAASEACAGAGREDGDWEGWETERDLWSWS